MLSGIKLSIVNFLKLKEMVANVCLAHCQTYVSIIKL